MIKSNKKITTKNLLIILTMLFAFLLVSCKRTPEVDKFELVIEELNIPKETTEDIELPTRIEAVPEASLLWSTDNYRVINSEGKFYRPDEDVSVNLELMVTIGWETQTYQFTVKAIGHENVVLETDKFKNPAGFASLGVTTRKGLDVSTNENYFEVETELELLDAMIATKNESNVIINVKKDLNMGARYIGRLLVEEGLWDGKNPKDTPYLDGGIFRENPNLPTIHPTLLEDGVGQLILQGRQGFMMYSENGSEINHMTTHIKSRTSSEFGYQKSKDIVFRNLRLAGIWEWDEIDRGDYKALDWDYFTIEDAENVWLDHLTIKTSYDGTVDVKGNTKNFTLSWLNLDYTVDDFIIEQFDWLENNRNQAPFYDELRKTVKKEDIMTVAAGQKKAFNFGNTESGPGFESITITMHDIYVKNLQDRFPRLRKGDIHLYNSVLDSEELQRLAHIDMKVISQGLIPTEQGAILMENSRFMGVREPIKTHQSSNLDESFTGRFKVVNSEYVHNDIYYKGSSEDRDFENPWKRSNRNVDYDLDFHFRNYENVPYEYELTEPELLTRKFKDNLIGAGTLEGFDWLDIVGQVNPNNVDKGIKIDESRIEGLDPFISEVGKEHKVFTPKIYNYYTGQELRVDRDFYYFVDTNDFNKDVPGVYKITYQLELIERPGVFVYYDQTYVVYDADGDNDIYDANIGQTFDNILSGEVNVYIGEGKLHYYLSNNNAESRSTILGGNQYVDITSPTVLFSDVDTTGFDYIHFVVETGGNYGEVYSVEIEKEVVIEIETTNDFISMLYTTDTTGKYYKLVNDLDFKGENIPYLSSTNIFNGVFDGQDFTIKNINRHAYGGGIFHTIGDGKIKNVVFDNINVDISRTPIYDEDSGLQIGWQGTSARSGIVAGQIKGGLGILENITIKNSKVDTENNYGAILVGKVESYSSAIIRNIKVYNSEVNQEGEYAGGLIAGIANHTETLIEDIFIDGLTVREGKTGDTFNGGSKMIGVIAGRVETGTTLRRVVTLNVVVDTEGATGGIFGKDDRKGQAVDTNFIDVFSNFTNLVPNGQYLGNLVGNPDRQYGHEIGLDNVWATPVVTGSSGLSVDSDNTIQANDINEAFWNANFSRLLESGLWEIVDGKISLK